MDYEYAGFGLNKRECIEIEDIRSKEEFDEIEKYYEEEGYDISPYYFFLGGVLPKDKGWNDINHFWQDGSKR